VWFLNLCAQVVSLGCDTRPFKKRIEKRNIEVALDMIRDKESNEKIRKYTEMTDVDIKVHG